MYIYTEAVRTGGSPPPPPPQCLDYAPPPRPNRTDALSCSGRMSVVIDIASFTSVTSQCMRDYPLLKDTRSICQWGQYVDPLLKGQ